MKNSPVIYFLTNACLALILGVYALSVAAGSFANLLARFSEASLLLFIWFFGLLGLWLALARYARQNNHMVCAFFKRLVRHEILFWALQVMLEIFIITGILLFSINAEKLGTAAPYYARLQPVLLWWVLFSLLTSLFLLLIKVPVSWEQARQGWISAWLDIRQLVTSLKPDSGENVYLVALVGLVLLALVDRLAFLNQPIRYDEARSFFYYATKPLIVPLTVYDAPNNHVLHSLLMNIAFNLFGKVEWGLRIPVLLTGMLIVPAAYLAGRNLFNKPAGILSAAFVTSSMSLIGFSTNARGYIMVTLATLLLVIFGQFLKTHNNRAGWLLFVIISALGFFSVPTMLYPFGGIILWLVLSALAGETKHVYGKSFIRSVFFAGVAVIILTFLLYAPIIAVSGIRSLIANEYVTPGFNTEASNYLAFVNELADTWHTDIPGSLSFLMGTGFIFACLFTGKISPHRVPLALVTIVWCVAEMLVQRVLPYKRVWLFFLPIYLIYASGGITGAFFLVIEGLRCRSWGMRQKIDLIRSHLLYGNGSGVVASLIALIISAGLSWNVLQSKSVLLDKETGTLRDAVAVSAFLKDYVESGVPILYTSPSSNVLGYYFMDFKRPAQRDEHKRILVVNTDFGQTLDHTAQYYFNFSEEEISRAILLKKFDSALVYEIIKE